MPTFATTTVNFTYTIRFGTARQMAVHVELRVRRTAIVLCVCRVTGRGRAVCALVMRFAKSSQLSSTHNWVDGVKFIARATIPQAWQKVMAGRLSPGL